MQAAVRVLGPVEVVSSSGQTVHLGGPKQSGVLALLALDAPRATSTDRLVQGLWGEDPPQSARNAVQVYVSGLRKVLRAEGADIARSGDGYRLVLGPVALDLDLFEERSAHGRSALLAGDAAHGEPLLADALTVVRGTPLGGLDDVPFAAWARPGLQARLVTARLGLAEALIGNSRPDEALPLIDEVLLEDPFLEHAWALLATAHYAAERHAEALRTCRRARQTLADELGLTPGPELTAVEQGVLQQTLVIRRAAPEQVLEEPDAAPWPELPPLPPQIVGREDLIERLERELAARQRMLTLAGLGGIGKTTVALALGHRLRAQGTDVLFVRVDHAGDTETALRSACESIRCDAGDDPLAAFATSLDGAVVIFDNVEQIAGFGEAIVSLLDRAPTSSFVVTSRGALDVEHELAVFVPPLEVTGSAGGRGPAVDLFLARMSAVRGRPVSADDVAAAADVCTMCGGIPMAITIAANHTRSMTARQLAERFAEKPELVATTPARAGVPQRHRSLAVVLEDAISRLDPGSQAVLGVVGSVAGSVSTELLARALEPVHGAELDRDIDGLLRVDLVRLDDTGRIGCLPPVREYVNSRDGSVHDADLLVGALVALAAEVAPRLLGGEQARGVEALRRDEDALRSALAHAVSGSDIDAAAAIVAGVHRYWLLNGRVDEARRWFDDIRRIPAEPSPATVVPELLAGTFSTYVNDPVSEDLLTDALRRAEQVGYPADRIHVNAWCCLAAFRVNVGRADLAEEAAARAAALAATAGDRSLVALARDLAGFVAAHSAQWERSLELMLAAIADARLDGDPADLVVTLCAAAEALDRLDRPRDAWQLLEEAADVARDLDPSPIVVNLIVHRGMVLSALDRPAAARGCLLESLHLQRSVYPNPIAVADVMYMLAATLADTGDSDLAARAWGAAEAIYGDHGLEPGRRTPPRFAAALQRTRTVDPGGFAIQFNLGVSDPGRTIERLELRRPSTTSTT